MPFCMSISVVDEWVMSLVRLGIAKRDAAGCRFGGPLASAITWDEG